MSKTRNLTEYDADDDTYSLVTQYYYYEYNDIKDGKDYQEDLFTVDLGE